jgi:hypothetical protein
MGDPTTAAAVAST